jgi:hypothetical protein
MFEFGHLFKPEAYKSEGVANGVMEKLDDLLKLYDRSMAKITLIHRNTGLTAVGKQGAFRELKAELAKELTGWAKFLNGYDEQIKRIEAAAVPTRHPRDDAAWEIRAAEIRTYLRTLDPVEVEGKVLAAAEIGDDELLQAVTYSPIPFKLSTEGLIEKVSRQRWEGEYPDEAAKLADLQTARAEALSALGSVRAELRKQGLEVRAEDLSLSDAA